MLSIFLRLYIFLFKTFKRCYEYAGGDGPSNSSTYVIDTSSTSNERYLVDHKIDGRVLYPATGYLCLVWRTLVGFRMKIAHCS